MKQEYKLLLTGWFSITLLDVLGSIASKQLGFSYSFLASISFIVYGTFGFIATKQRDLKTGVLIAAGIGFFDSTIGWKISTLLGVNTGVRITPLIWFITLLFVTGSAALCGLIGGGLTRIIKSKT